MGPKCTPGNGWKPCDRGSRPDITDFLERLPDSFLLHTKHSNRSETYGDGPWISYQLYPIIVIILLLSLLSLLLFGFLLLFIATIRVLTVSLTTCYNFLPRAMLHGRRPWCSGCSRSRRKPLKVLGWKAPFPTAEWNNEMWRCLGVENKKQKSHLKAQRSSFSPMISWGAFPSFWDVPDMFDGYWDVHLESWNKHLWEATRTTPLRRTCWILSISRILQDSQWRYLKTILPNKGLKKRFMIGLIAWVSLVAPECLRLRFRDWASWSVRYFLTCHLYERYVKCMHTSCIQHSLIQPCMDAYTQVHVTKSLANITCFLISKRNLKQQRSISGPPRSHFGCIFLGGNLLTLTLDWNLGMFKNLMLSSSPKVGGSYGCPINPLSQRYWPRFISIPGYLARASK